MNPKISVNFCNGCHVEIICPNYNSYRVIISDNDIELLNILSDESLISYDIHSDNYKFINYKVQVFYNENLIFTEKIDLTGKKVKINFDSKALGDNIAWIGQVDKFQKKHQCQVYISCQHKQLFEKVYPNLIFSDAEPNPDRGDNTIIPGLKSKSCKDFFCFYSPCKCYYASYDLGFYSKISYLRNIPLCKVASDMLGLEYEEIRPNIFVESNKRVYDNPYVCISVQSTAQLKYWNNKSGWQEVVDYLKSVGYEVVCIDLSDNYGKDGYINSAPNGIINKTGNFSLQERICDILHCDFFIGLSSGLSWLAWALGKPVVMISGFTSPITEFKNPYRVFNSTVCNSCWNDESISDILTNGWSYCPRNKDFECSSEISSKMVIDKVALILTKI